MSYNGHTIATNQELAFDPPELSRWNHFWWRAGRFFRTPAGKAVAVLLFVVALAITIITKGAAAGLLFGLMAVVGLAIGGFVAGLRARDSGDGFWDGFVNHIRDNWAMSVAISSVLSLATLGVGAAVSGVAGAVAKKKGAVINTLPNGVKPAKKSLTNVEARNWYVNNVRDIGNRLNPNLSIKKQAKQAFKLRNKYKNIARDAMADRSQAAILNASENVIFKDLLFKYSGSFEEIIRASMRTRVSVNAIFGII